MSRHEETRLALVELLRTFGDAPTGLYSVGVPMVHQGFSQDEIFYALVSLGREKSIELLPENQLRVLRLQDRQPEGSTAPSHLLTA
jgi:hypothetical protein